VLLIAASILAARNLAQYDSGARIPATVSVIADAVHWAERIMDEIDRRPPATSAPQRAAETLSGLAMPRCETASAIGDQPPTQRL
jgi:hypothetical protein